MIDGIKTLNSTITQKIPDYCYVSSKFVSSLSKSKQKFPTYQLKDYPFKSIKESSQRIKQIGEEKYKNAMIHMQKFNKYQKEMKQRKVKENQFIDNQCTFKPKINHNKKYKNQTSRFMVTNFTEKHKQNFNLNPQKQNTGNNEENQRFNKQQYKNERLLRWGNNNNLKSLNKTIQFEKRRRRSSSQLISSRSEGKNSRLQNLSLYKKELNYQNLLSKDNQTKAIDQRQNIIKDNQIGKEQPSIYQKNTINQTKISKNSFFNYNNNKWANDTFTSLKIQSKKNNNFQYSKNNKINQNQRKIYTQTPLFKSIDSSFEHDLQQNLNQSKQITRRIQKTSSASVKNNQYTNKFQKLLSKLNK